MPGLNAVTRKTLPACLLGAVILSLLLCLAKLGDNQQQWRLDNWDLPYTGCTNWCS
ncbi:hypothetical protein [Pseudomonas sp. N040]|uniref:hypothetical protein n=1 Tax=Pseudomonas sp. N040 TaxID=2785325 RepID=UPI0018A329FF|nr:hypothetical protein [Pseudomonas sp. N040]MBF7730942.1 hypothetical protein [Pseudomonas sp. N040]MBW7014585.1 hypothetical protein [Pseudomonas sp. N040]